MQYLVSRNGQNWISKKSLRKGQTEEIPDLRTPPSQTSLARHSCSNLGRFISMSLALKSSNLSVFTTSWSKKSQLSYKVELYRQ